MRPDPTPEICADEANSTLMFSASFTNKLGPTKSPSSCASAKAGTLSFARGLAISRIPETHEPGSRKLKVETHKPLTAAQALPHQLKRPLGKFQNCEQRHTLVRRSHPLFARIRLDEKAPLNIARQ